MAYPTLPMEILQQNIKRMKKINRYDAYLMVLTDCIIQVNLTTEIVNFYSNITENLFAQFHLFQFIPLIFLEGSTKNGKFSNPRTNRHD